VSARSTTRRRIESDDALLLFLTRLSLSSRDWVTGYGKRKTQRRKYAVKQAEEKARKERLQERKERREEFRKTHGLADDAGGGGGGDSKPAGTVDTEVVEYDSGVTVIVEGLD
jgi:ribosomal RNA-processing protein 17